ncbi:hypothetical protein [Novosphingobium pentaromativorans]|uniref:Uncharacterized protein n=1 Tax=Novosphingobium pentaromativorans US6-1 TaxID=1088721 RepID=G6EDR5_9SPHN|nr:hypothetical protein [Novosphingobium pentaromativorans]AIT79666.1 hypothetical protein JI59_07650 [Novosphingobium pentaromativorans US6-1]EHJ60553.1 hypothetical protein NSU_2486 [Novosphingobium pentaromativorans US6-1]
MSFEDTGAIRADERARIVGLLARYPDLPGPEFDELRTWFERGATPLDLGLIAGNPDVAEQYRAFRESQIDRFTRRDIWKAGAFAAAILAVFSGIFLLMPH